jgi:hypothetical protein
MILRDSRTLKTGRIMWKHFIVQISKTYLPASNIYIYIYIYIITSIKYFVEFLRHLLGITQLNKKRIDALGEKNRSTEYINGYKAVPGKRLKHVQRMNTHRISKISVTI